MTGRTGRTGPAPRGTGAERGAGDGPRGRGASALLVAVVFAVGIGAGGAARAQAPPRVTVTTDRQRVALTEEFELSVSLEGTFDEVQVPPLDDFQVVQEGMTRVLNGRRASVTRNYTLRPKKAGTLTIGPARLVRDGKVVAESAPLTVVVAEPEVARPVSAAEAMDLSRYAGEGCHPVNSIVNKNNQYVFTTVTGMHNFSGSNRCQITIALVSKNKVLRI